MSDAEIVRVAERALLVRFPGVELERAVAKAQALWFQAESWKANDRRLPSKGKTKNEIDSGFGRIEGFERTRETKGEGLPSREETGDERPPEILSAVLGAGSLLVRLADASSAADLAIARRWIEDLVGRVDSLDTPSADAGPADSGEARVHRIRVRYGGEEGPDLTGVAGELGISTQRVIELHSSAEYRVAFVGFAPGFPYLIGLPPALEVARLSSPRPRVPPGSVAIAGPFAGIYPSATPGGWRLLGRAADLVLFDPSVDPPARLAPGDRVRFVPESA